MSHYYLLVITGLSEEQGEALSASCFEYGAEGISENLPFIQRNDKYEPELLPVDETTLHVYFSSQPPKDLLQELESKYQTARYQIFKKENKDWLAEWKKGYKPFEIAGRVWVVPSWLPVPSEAQKAIRIEPGMAFGTGTHETTQLASQLLAKYYRSGRVIDVGTGTGILGFLAEILGAGEVVGVEIDAEARRSARENVELNNSRMKIVDEQIREISGSYDWVIANIIDGVLVEIQSDLKRVLAPKGYLLLTGILAEREEGFLSRFDQEGLQLVERLQLGEWVGLLYAQNLR